MNILRALALALALAACGDNVPSEHTPPEAGIAGSDSPSALEDYVYSRQPGQPGKPRVLVYTFENYWRHFSSINCMLAIQAMNETRGFTVLVTNHPLGINAETLAEVDVVAFCVTSGSGLTAQGRADLESWIRAGGGTVGFHSASFTEPFWNFYVEHIGTRFATHAPGLWPATVKVSQTHPITAGLSNFELADEWYVFGQRPDTIPGAQIVMDVDEDSFPADFPVAYRQGYHPFAWTNDHFGGRMFYSSFGHNPDTFSDPNVLEIVGRSIEWAAHQR